MAQEKPQKKSYIKELIHFYFAPELRSIVTLLFLGVFGYFSLYYIDNVFLALEFLLYIVFSHSAFQNISLLFIGMGFVVSLVFPFLLSFYYILMLHKVWDKREWATYLKWLITCIMIIGGVFLILMSDNIMRLSARQESMRSFIEDSNLSQDI